MKLCALTVKNCRNIEQAVLEPDSELTVIAGPNGQGKTNLLESIFLLTGSKSFRGAKDMELVRQGQIQGYVCGQTQSSQKQNTVEIWIEGPEKPRKGRFAKVNGVDYGRASEVAGIFTAVVFEPNHLSLVKSGPEGRRRFLDAALCQLYPGYVAILRRFTRVLTQKNALLKHYFETRDADAQLEVFNTMLATAGGEMIRRRRQWLATAGPAAEQFYTELSKGAESLSVCYKASCEPEELLELLQRSHQADIRAGFSTAGPHREDIDILINHKSARTFGSQGQQRSAVLALKLAEAETARQVCGEHPVLLLDDVLSELDETRQAFLLSRMGGKQSFVTTCDAAAFSRTAGKVVHVQDGQIQL